MYQSIVSVAQAATSSICINGAAPVTAPNNPGSNGIGTTNKLTMGAFDSGAAAYAGYIYEIIVKAGAVSAANQTALSTNQHAIGTGW